MSSGGGNDPNVLDVTPAAVRSSAADIDNVASLAATCRSSLAAAMGGNFLGWQQDGRPGFAQFVDILHTQADRIRADLTAIGENLRVAATAYENDDQANRARLTLHHDGPAPGSSSC